MCCLQLFLVIFALTKRILDANGETKQKKQDSKDCNGSDKHTCNGNRFAFASALYSSGATMGH